jgi:hypothetical protein
MRTARRNRQPRRRQARLPTNGRSRSRQGRGKRGPSATKEASQHRTEQVAQPNACLAPAESYPPRAINALRRTGAHPGDGGNQSYDHHNEFEHINQRLQRT